MGLWRILASIEGIVLILDRDIPTSDLYSTRLPATPGCFNNEIKLRTT